MPKETAIRLKGRALILAAFPGSRVIKYHGSMYTESGVADEHYCLAPFGLYVAIEWKRGATETPTKLQEDFLEEINKAGGLAFSCHSPARAVRTIKNFLPQWLEGIKRKHAAKR